MPAQNFQSPVPPPMTRMAQPAAMMPYAPNGVFTATQAGTAIIPPPVLRTAPQAGLPQAPYGAASGDSRPY